MRNKWERLIVITMLAVTLAACQPGSEAEMPTTTEPTIQLAPTSIPTEVPPTQAPTAQPSQTPTHLPTLPPTATRRPSSNVRSLRESADLGTGKGPAYSQDWSPDGLLLVTADTENIRIWNTSSRREAGVLTGHIDFIWGLAWSPPTPDGISILASASQDGTVRLWDVAAGTMTASFATGWAFCVDWSPDGQQLAVGTYNGEVQMWDISSQQMLSSWRTPSASPVISIGWSPDGSSIASGALSGEIYLWDAATGSVTQTIEGYTTARSDVNGLAWSPDGSRLGTAHQDGQVRLWNPLSGELVLAIGAHDGWVRGMAWSPNGSLLASTGQDRRIVLWDPVTGEAYAEQHHNRLPVWSVSWSPDGTMVASGAGAYEERHIGATIVWRVP